MLDALAPHDPMRRLPTIHMFWHGAPLSRIERLSMASFVAQGHRVDLHVYDPPASVPVGVHLQDASRILARTEIFTHHRTGSLGPFADWFRYRLLDERGGIWADTDVVCLKPLDYDDPIVFGWEDKRYINTAVLGLPAKHALARWMADACADPHRPHPYDGAARRLRKLVRRYAGNRRDDIRWGEYGPKGFTRAAQHFGLLQNARPVTHFYPVPCERWQELFARAGDPGTVAADFPGESRTVHLWHAMMHAQPGFDKNARFDPNSRFERLWTRYRDALELGN